MTSKELALLIRCSAVEITSRSNSSHIASVLSMADIVAVLYNDVMNIFPENPENDLRDRFVLSKGHAGVGVYIALAELGYFPKKKLLTYCNDGGVLSGHVSHYSVPGVELSTGSLGHGISVACGMAMAAKVDKKTHRVFALIGDGECDEGSVWETALFANHYRLSNFYVIVDHNKMQSLGYCEKTIELIDLAAKWDSFGWNVIVVDGHSHEQIKSAFANNVSEKPTVIVANTIKGKGISFMENNILWHYRAPLGEQYEKAMKELKGDIQ